ncbi:hypothetical protein M0R45_036804 [Rubus argutus]|uniref:TIR domain-containing protein n=1 Tax=Rubus argutus TaxID=59490 RepID=A0AAW1VYJ0_RUBAR
MALARAQKSYFSKISTEFTYDVFLSFRGEDTRKTFTDHLYTALGYAGFRTFRDDPELERGENIKQKLEKAIQQSRSSVIVFSKDYTSSRWCLDELVMILERKSTSDHVVLPVFYDVEPSDVRKQAENLAKVPKYQENQSTEKLNGWRAALREVADLAGMVLRNEADGHESKFIQNIVGVIQDKLGRRVPLSDVQEKLQKKLLYVNSVLDDAQGKQLTNTTVKDWFNGLKEAAYDAEDLLQEIKAEALRQDMEPESAAISTSKVQELSRPPLIITEAEKVLERLEDIVKQKKQYLGLEASVGHKFLRQAPSRETTSLVDDSGVYGRDQDKEDIIKLLLSNDAAGEKISVIPIIGMGGIGKTTLAQFTYNDIRVKRHFKLQAWVCISDGEFDVTRITQTIYESITGNTYCGIAKFDLLQNALKEKLMMKRFLLVLDDVWNENYMEWDKLRQPFESGAFGSKIIVTARNQRVASAMCTLPSHHLMQISDDNCWLLFAKHAFGNADLLYSQHPDLASIGRQIATKCKGLPLAAKSLGGLLHSELDVEEWVQILESDIWELSEKEIDILPALWLSYRYLPSHLKRCFAYCAIFPKDYQFTKSKMVLLWMAEDLLQPKKKKTLEQVGDGYFNDLISRSFFQSKPTQEHDPIGESECLFTMHDLINDLAKFVSGEFCFRLEDHNSSDIVGKTRHFSYMKRKVGTDGCPNFDALCKAKSLHTFVSFEKLYISSRGLWPASNCLGLLDLKCLRLLDLSRYDVRELPDSIGNMKHLRHLDLSHSSIEKLPDALCTLYNLQTLLLFGCEDLVELPTNLGRLIKLRHVDISSTKIKKMPRNMGKLKDLQFLSDFVLDKDTGENIVELKELPHLHKRLRISGLDNIVCGWDGLEVNINDMKYLKELVLEWGGDTEYSIQDRLVLEQLQPHANLKLLRIESYRGTSFPNWVGDHSFSNLSSVALINCKFCLSFPPLGQLPSLVKLHIEGAKVESVGLEFYGCGVKPFRSLNELSFIDMLEWQEWCYDVKEGGEIFPNLCKLTLKRCPKLAKMLPSDKFPKLESLQLSSLNFTGCLFSQESKFMSLSLLTIEECPEFECFPDGGIDAPKLKDMSIVGCKKFRLLPEGMRTIVPSLEALTIRRCPEFISFPQSGLAPALVTLSLDGNEKLWANGTQCGLQRLNSLQTLTVASIELPVFPEEGLLPTSLTHLSIFQSPNLTTLVTHFSF